MVTAEKTNSDPQRIYGAIKARLIAHEYKPGEHLMAKVIAEELDVSEAPVRDILTRLCGEGLVEMTDREGFYVRPISETEIRELYEFNLLLLQYSLGLNGNMRIPPKKFPNRLRVVKGTEPPPPPCVSTIVRITDDLFAHIAGQSGNSQIVRIVWSINDRLHHVRMRECEVLESPADHVLELCRFYYQNGGDGLATR